MLVAINKYNERKVAYKADKSESPYVCPKCKGKVALKKGRIIIHHFSHYPDSNCNYGEGESNEHLLIKQSIYDGISKHDTFFEKCEMELYLHGVRPDVSFDKDGIKVVIEIQKSDITHDIIDQRMRRYSRLGYHICWVFPKFISLYSWVRYLYIIQNRKSYSHVNGSTIKAIGDYGKIISDTSDNGNYDIYNDFIPLLYNGYKIWTIKKYKTKKIKNDIKR